MALLLANARAATKLDERPSQPGEWGYRPAEGDVSAVTPPGFSWRPQKDIRQWDLEVSGAGRTAYRAHGIGFNVHTPHETLAPGKYSWRYRGIDSKGSATNWSLARAFEVARGATEMPLPGRAELLARVPKSHPRLFVRPEDVTRLRGLARGRLGGRYAGLARECDRLLKSPPPTKEPPKYPKGMKRGSDEWRKIWWGNRRYVQKALGSAATLAFTRLVSERGAKRDEYGRLAKRILLECAEWDPKGATGYRYNDEAGMPYNYYFSRTYTFAHDLLSEAERGKCRRVMKVRGDEMYRHLHPRHFWRPYSSHSNRAWHFLGEVGVAFLGEVEGAGDWVWFAANVFTNCYPVWSDDDGGWHEGSNYWRSYQGRFTWWADVMKSAMGIDAYRKPYYSKVGYYAMYLMPPGKVGGGFGDLCAKGKAEHNRELVSTYAAQAENGHWAWYVGKLGGMSLGGGYVGFVRGALPGVKPRAPTDLPASRLFRGTGQAFLNTQIEDARKSVQVVFKSSPFGTQSHGYEANNSFLLWAYGERMLIRSGRRDSYGSSHHKGWMWSTRSTNCITLNGGEGQGRRKASARGEIVDFETSTEVDIVVGEAGSAYVDEDGRGAKRPLKRFTRALVFVKPDVLVVYDRLVATEPATFDYWLHAQDRMDAPDQHAIQIRRGDVACDIDIMLPEGLGLSQTDQYDPNPRSRVKLREWHLTASTQRRQARAEFVAIYRVRRKVTPSQGCAAIESIKGGYALRVPVEGGEAAMLLPSTDGARLSALGLRSEGELVVEVRKGARAVRTLRAELSR
jgi:hypothetical protein